MGDPKKLRKSWEKPKRLFDKARIQKENKYVKEHGFNRKREIWKTENLFKNYKRRARKILAAYDEEEKNILVNKLASLGILSEGASLDDVLNLNIEDFFNRRLQTLVYKLGLANTVKQARQFIAHKKVFVGDRIIDQPNYLVSVEEEKKIKLKKKSKKSKKAKEEEKSEGGVEEKEQVEKVGREKQTGGEQLEKGESKEKNEESEGGEEKLGEKPNEKTKQTEEQPKDESERGEENE